MHPFQMKELGSSYSNDYFLYLLKWNFRLRKSGKLTKHFFLSFCKNPHLRICLLILERKEGGEREKYWWSVTSRMCLSQKLNPQPTYVLWLGIKPSNLWNTGWCSSLLSYLARAQQNISSTYLMFSIARPQGCLEVNSEAEFTVHLTLSYDIYSWSFEMSV